MNKQSKIKKHSVGHHTTRKGWLSPTEATVLAKQLKDLQEKLEAVKEDYEELQLKLFEIRREYQDVFGRQFVVHPRWCWGNSR